MMFCPPNAAEIFCAGLNQVKAKVLDMEKYSAYEGRYNIHGVKYYEPLRYNTTTEGLVYNEGSRALVVYFPISVYFSGHDM